MAQKTINLGTSELAGDGESIRSAFGKINDNFTETYNDIATNLASVFDGDYNSLSNKPVLFSGDYNDLTNKPVLFSGDYDDLTNKPVLFSGDYNDLTNKPVLFSGDLTGSVFADDSTLLVDSVNGEIPPNVVVADRWTKMTSSPYQASHGEKIFTPDDWGGGGADITGPDNPETGDWFEVVSFAGTKQVYPTGLSGSSVSYTGTKKHFVFDGTAWKDF